MNKCFWLEIYEKSMKDTSVYQKNDRENLLFSMILIVLLESINFAEIYGCKSYVQSSDGIMVVYPI